MPRILVIDDCLPLLAEAVRVLRHAGYDTVGAHNGKEGLKILQGDSIDAVVTDLFMPEVDGYEILQFLGRQPHPTPVVAMSANPHSFDALRAARHLGAAKILWKPFTGAELIAAVLAIAGYAGPASSSQPRPES